ncbi:MAG: alkyl hydroperoxide reductase [Chromatiales bacterium 21-64-14]|nr:MAG: alkyl hydroperoxide reductase [Chromatiales bacterium 21-64-14]HQU17412.1 peroxiredoxin-like family protein [Gammaproteobacteria bacterium]
MNTSPELDSQTTALAAEMNQVKQQFLAGLPDAVKQTMMQAAQKLAASGVGERAVNTGRPAPDFALPNLRGASIRLSRQWTRGPVVLSFYRGGWCPFCNLELAALQRHLPDIRSLGAALVAVSPETPDHSLSTAQKHGLEFEVLSDVGDQAARAYGLVFVLPEALRALYQEWGIDLPAWNGDDSFELPIPATYVIDTGGMVRAAHVSMDYTTRMEPTAILAALRDIRA